MHDDDAPWDCIVVGGGAAGLSAALVLGRARQRTLLVDAGEQSNLPAHGIGGLLGHDGRPPAELYALGRRELATYPTVEVRDGKVVSGRRDGERLVLALDDGHEEVGRRVLLATGADYRPPDLPGLAERFGRSVFHCPFCHGWEARDGQLGVLASGTRGMQTALLLGEWSDDVTLFADGPAGLETADLARLEAAGIAVEERAVAALEGPDDELAGVVFTDGERRACTGLLVPAPLHQRSDLATQLGATTTERQPMAVDVVEVDPMQRAADGVFAAGDASPAMPSVAAAIAAGSMAGAAVVHSLVAETHDLPTH